MVYLSKENKEEIKVMLGEAMQTAIAEFTKIITSTVDNAVKLAILSLQTALDDTILNIKTLETTLIEKTNTISELETKISTLESTMTTKFNTFESSWSAKFDNIDAENQNLKFDLYEAAEEQEQYSRKDCLRIEGLIYEQDETNASLKAAVIAELAKNNVSINSSDIYRLHRSGKPYPLSKFQAFAGGKKYVPPNHDDGRQTAQVIIKFTNWAARPRVFSLHFTKNADLHVKVDLTRQRSELMSTARSYLRDKKLKGYVYPNGECKLILKNANNERKHIFKNFDEFEHLAKVLIKDESFYKKNAWLYQTKVVNIKLNPEWQNHPKYVYVGRRSSYGCSEFGNPFKLSKFSRAESLKKYESYIRDSQTLMAKLPSLKGCILGCFCKNPYLSVDCHADILIKLIEEL